MIGQMMRCGSRHLSPRKLRVGPQNLVRTNKAKYGIRYYVAFYSDDLAELSCEYITSRIGLSAVLGAILGASAVYTLQSRSAFAEESSNHPHVCVALGGVGVGKSSLLSKMLSQDEVFRSSPGVKSRTLETAIREGRVEGTNLILVDTPGRDSTSLSAPEMFRELQMIDVLKEIPHGINCFILVKNVHNPRFSEEDVRRLQLIEERFGPNVWQHIIMVYTHCDPGHEEIWIEKKTAISNELDSMIFDTFYQRGVPVIFLSNQNILDRNGFGELTRVIQRFPKFSAKNIKSPQEGQSWMWRPIASLAGGAICNTIASYAPAHVLDLGLPMVATCFGSVTAWNQTSKLLPTQPEIKLKLRNEWIDWKTKYENMAQH